MNLNTEISVSLWNSIRRSYESEAWSNAILDGMHHFSDVVRAKSGLLSDGAPLAGQAFGGKDPKIKINRLATESDKNIQAGVEQLVRGLYQAIRNPRSHERLPDDQKTCDSIIIFIDYLLSVIGSAKAAFSIEDIVNRINDENFVTNNRYAELILSEIPKNKRFDTLLAAFESRDLSNSSPKKNFFQAMITSLEVEDQKQFFETVSDHLRNSHDDSELRSVFQLIDPKQWQSISEADRLRSENRIVKNILTGRYSSQNEKCLAGGLATWARSFFPHFSLKTDVLSALQQSLRSNSRERQDYVLNFFFSDLDKLADAPPHSLRTHIIERLKSGDTRYKSALDLFMFVGPTPWTEPFEKELRDFVPNESSIRNDFEEEDIPF